MEIAGGIASLPLGLFSHPASSLPPSPSRVFCEAQEQHDLEVRQEAMEQAALCCSMSSMAQVRARHTHAHAPPMVHPATTS